MTVRSPGMRVATTADAPPAAAISWATLMGKPAAFPPSPHTHPIKDVDGLGGALDAKANLQDPGDLRLLFENALIDGEYNG